MSATTLLLEGRSYLYDFHVIYNYAKGGTPKTADTELSTDFTKKLVTRLSGWDYTKAYYYGRDSKPGRNVLNELFRIIKDSKWTIVVLTPGFLENCWTTYCQQSAFKQLLDKNSTHLLIPLALNVDIPEDLGLNDVLFFDDNWEKGCSEEWDKLKMVLKDNVSDRSVASRSMQKHQQECSDNVLRTETRGHPLTHPASDTSLSSLVRNMSLTERETRKSKKDILLQLHSAVDHTRKKNVINVTRQNVIEGVMRGFRRTTFDPLAQLDVKFGGEDGIDVGGLTRECMRLLRKAISQLPIFFGNDNSKVLVLVTPALDKGTYKIAGRMLAYMLVHHGTIPNFLDQFLYDVLSSGVDSVHAQISNVSDYELRGQLEKIAASDASNFFDAVMPLENLIHVSGNASLMRKPDRNNELVDALCKYLVVNNMKSAYAQFSEGLSTLGVLDAIQAHGDTMRPCFVHSVQPLTADDIIRLYIPRIFSADGSNRKMKEDDTVSWWRDFILDTEEEENLPAVLAFLTGLDEIPQIGFDCDASITFRHRQDLDVADPKWEFPIINTCSLELSLPILESYDMFVKRFTAAMSVNTFTNA